MAEIIQLGDLDEHDVAFQEFIEALKEDNDRIVYLVQKKDGSVHLGTNSRDRRDVLYDFYRLQKVCQLIVEEID